MADVVDHDVVMLAPEEGDRREAFSPAEHVACRRRTLPLGDRPMLDADIVAGLGVGPARDIACREDAGRARFEEGVDQHAAVCGEPGGLGKCEIGRSEEHTSEIQSLMRRSTADYCVK